MRLLPPSAVLVVAVLASLVLPATLRAQRGRNNPNNPNNQNNPNATPGPSPTGTVSPTQNRFWRCELPGGVFLVNLNNIQSISSSEYIVDGAARVTEVTVATASSVEGRFYYLEPVTPSAVGATLQQLQQHVQDLAASHVDDARAHGRVPAHNQGEPRATLLQPGSRLDERQGGVAADAVSAPLQSFRSS